MSQLLGPGGKPLTRDAFMEGVKAPQKMEQLRTELQAQQLQAAYDYFTAFQDQEVEGKLREAVHHGTVFARNFAEFQKLVKALIAGYEGQLDNLRAAVAELSGLAKVAFVEGHERARLADDKEAPADAAWGGSSARAYLGTVVGPDLAGKYAERVLEALSDAPLALADEEAPGDARES